MHDLAQTLAQKCALTRSHSNPNLSPHSHHARFPLVSRYATLWLVVTRPAQIQGEFARQGKQRPQNRRLLGETSGAVVAVRPPRSRRQEKRPRRRVHPHDRVALRRPPRPPRPLENARRDARVRHLQTGWGRVDAASDAGRNRISGVAGRANANVGPLRIQGRSVRRGDSDVTETPEFRLSSQRSGIVLNELGQMNWVRWTGSDELGQMNWVRCTVSDELGQMNWVKLTRSDELGQINWVRWTGSDELSQMNWVRWTGSDELCQMNWVRWTGLDELLPAFSKIEGLNYYLSSTLKIIGKIKTKSLLE